LRERGSCDLNLPLLVIGERTSIQIRAVGITAGVWIRIEGWRVRQWQSVLMAIRWMSMIASTMMVTYARVNKERGAPG
jgi:hypothetical protein